MCGKSLRTGLCGLVAIFCCWQVTRAMEGAQNHNQGGFGWADPTVRVPSEGTTVKFGCFDILINGHSLLIQIQHEGKLAWEQRIDNADTADIQFIRCDYVAIWRGQYSFITKNVDGVDRLWAFEDGRFIQPAAPVPGDVWTGWVNEMEGCAG